MWSPAVSASIALPPPRPVLAAKLESVTTSAASLAGSSQRSPPPPSMPGGDAGGAPLTMPNPHQLEAEASGHVDRAVEHVRIDRRLAHRGARDGEGAGAGVGVEVPRLVQSLGRAGTGEREGPCRQAHLVGGGRLARAAAADRGVGVRGLDRLAQRAGGAGQVLVRGGADVDRQRLGGRGDGEGESEGCGDGAGQAPGHSVRCSPAFSRRSRSSRSSSGVGSNCEGSGRASSPDSPNSFSNNVVVA